MVSIAAQQVGRKVLESIGKNKRPILGKFALEAGYAQNSADNPKQIVETKSYREIVDPVLNKMIKERQRVINAMGKRKLNKVQYDKLSKVMDELTKNIQLLSGGRTGNESIIINWE